MSFPLLKKVLWDVRWPLLLVGLLLCIFQILWAKITERITLQLLPILVALSLRAGENFKDVEAKLLEGPGQIFRTIIGGEMVNWQDPQSTLSIAYVHPFIQTVLCIWAIGRSANAITGEIDKGTMELLLAQPLARWRVIVTHFAVDLIVIPALCLAILLGTTIGTSIITLKGIDLRQFPPAMLNVGALLFAISGYVTWFSAMGRMRGRVIMLAVGVTLVQFLVNLLGQMWDAVAFLRPFTVFYYYQPQVIILKDRWTVTVFKDVPWLANGQGLFDVNVIVVLLLVGLSGYALALYSFSRRDLPAPL